jgi:predicted aldo/keto reductase-like oxidoreductase
LCTLNIDFSRLGAVGEPAGAFLCEKYGECEEACPQNLPIQENLKDGTITDESYCL